MTVENVISIIAVGSVVATIIVLPKLSYLAARRESYQIALLRRARVKWERSVAKVLDALEKVK